MLVRSVTTFLEDDPSFYHNICCCCSRKSCEVITRKAFVQLLQEKEVFQNAIQASRDAHGLSMDQAVSHSISNLVAPYPIVSLKVTQHHYIVLILFLKTVEPYSSPTHPLLATNYFLDLSHSKSD